MNNIVTIKFGSHLYGTATPESDLDFKSVHLPNAKDIILQRVPNSVKKSRPKAEGEKNNAGDIDEESYSLQRFLQLLAEGQTGAIDMIFAPDYAIVSGSYLWYALQDARESFLTKKSVAFVGYCRTQANKYGIKGSRVAAAKKAAEFFAGLPLTKHVGDFDAELRGLADDHTRVVTEETRPGFMQTFFQCCDRKVDFTATVKQALEIYMRVYQGYGARARMAQSNEGVDWKALSHAVRVATEAIELLETHHVTFPLVNAAHLLEIKRGQLPYAQVAEEIEELLVKVEEAEARSTLPQKPDYKLIEEIVEEEYGRIVREDGWLI